MNNSHEEIYMQNLTIKSKDKKTGKALFAFIMRQVDRVENKQKFGKIEWYADREQNLIFQMFSVLSQKSKCLVRLQLFLAVS